MTEGGATRGRFITLEGVEGSGKSTLARALAPALSGVLRARGIALHLTREPGGTPLAESIRAVVLARGAEPMPPAAEMLLMFAARAVHVANLVRPALERGDWVLCDRFTDATVAYQGFGRGLDRAAIGQLAAIAHPGLRPDVTLLLDVAPAEGLRRARGRNEGGDRFEDEAVAFFERVRQGYLTLAAEEPGRFRLLDATQPAEAVLAAALAAVGAGEGA